MKNIENKNKYNVIIIGLDAVSRLNFHRQMPKTIDYLQNLGAIEYHGYNKVADNTFPNLIPILSGMNVEELTNSCWPSEKDYFDNCTKYFVWSKFQKIG